MTAPASMAATWSIAVFAHNEAPRIAATLRSIEAAAHGMAVEVVVLANGCQDGTAQVVRDLAAASPHLRVVEIALADKAHAWNEYVHAVAATATLHVFVDGDVQLAPGALQALARRLEQVPAAHAVGGLPTTGRDREGWSQRMLSQGTLAGGLYALRGSFVQTLRQRGIRLPQGLVGEDWLVSLWAGRDLQPTAMALDASGYVVFAPEAGFAFRSLSPWRLRDYRTYARRLWRYAQRGVQYEMVWQWLRLRLPESLPPDVRTLYAQAPTPSRLLWTGSVLGSLLRCLAVHQVRRVHRGQG
ncbi:glycosyltransferase family 2 protein [Rhodoferax sp. WC2427]|uniref:glycosyltransferase family 2 protein n=1 Tax=Rhodoferax sp. WC2427 TaxID=3234144 RepID=UPI003464EC35